MSYQDQRQVRRIASYEQALDDGDYDYAEYLLGAIEAHDRLTKNDEHGTVQV